jgi:arginase family enzyme
MEKAIQIIKVPGINGLGKTKGCEKAGNAIISFLKDIYTNEQNKLINKDSLDLEEIHLDNGNLDEANNLIYKNAFEAYDKEKVIFLGGDHSISYSTVRGFLDYCQTNGKEPCLIVFDAHADCMPPLKNPTHEEWLRACIEEGFPAENILLVGVRNLDQEESRFLKENKIRTISINRFLENLEDVTEILMEFANGKELYVSIDIDVIDPVFASATGYPEIGGFTSRQALYVFQRINKMKNLKAIDIVEINPEKDKEDLTIKLGAKILSEFI